MSLRQARPRSFSNEYGRGRSVRDTESRLESRLQAGKSDNHRLLYTGEMTTNKGRDHGCSSRDRLVYVTACLIGHEVEVQVKNGSIYSGIFHATNAENDFGIILKMARLVKDNSLRDRKAISESISTAPSKVLIIPSEELVQVMAKDVSLTMISSSFTHDLQGKHHEIMLDSYLSQSRHVELERELERWVPDEDAPHHPELENVFDEPWNRKWDQFERNETLFGVKSTFDEELYTTKLEKGPRMRELEREALRIAKEIEGEETRDSHLAEERGFQYHGYSDIDEETRYSSVLRAVDDNEYKEDDDTNVDSCNSETFEDSSNYVTEKLLTDLRSCQSTGAEVLNSTLTTEQTHAFQLRSTNNHFCSVSNDRAKPLSSEKFSTSSSALDSKNRIQGGEFHGPCQLSTSTENQIPVEDAVLSKVNDLHLPFDMKKEVCDKGALSSNAVAYAPSSSAASLRNMEKSNSIELPKSAADIGKKDTVAPSGNPRVRIGASDFVGITPPSSVSKLSPSSSVGSLSSEKSNLNPHAKEFRFNPNAKSFVPSPQPLRLPSLVPDGSFYYPANVSTGSHIHTPLGFGMGALSSHHQPIVMNPQGAAPPPYVPPFGQQMIVNHSRPVLYMPDYGGYPPELTFKRREF